MTKLSVTFSDLTPEQASALVNFAAGSTGAPAPSVAHAAPPAAPAAPAANVPPPPPPAAPAAPAAPAPSAPPPPPPAAPAAGGTADIATLQSLMQQYAARHKAAGVKAVFESLGLPPNLTQCAQQHAHRLPELRAAFAAGLQ